MAFQGKVKSVTSGDSLVVVNPNNPTQERLFSFAFVTGPRMMKEGDEPFAFQSREFLRNIAVGKQIRCIPDYTVPNSNRTYGHALIRDGPDLPEESIKAGWLKIREDAGRKEESEEVLQRLETLRKLESEARGDNKGLHVGTGGIIEVQNDLGGPDFMKEWKGKTVDGIVERVFNGDRVLVRLLLSDKKHVQVMTLVAGIRTPSSERPNQSNGQTQPEEEFGNEARQYVEDRLLQRQVKIEIVGASPQGQLIASVIHPRGNIAGFLLTDGLARCNDFHSTMLGEKMAALRAAEKQAQSGKLRIHRNFQPKSTEGSNLDMTVAKIISADTIIVRNKAGTEKTINFSSVRGPRTNESSEAPFRDEAKEFMRKKLIGKHVRISIDGSKPASEQFEARDVATVTQNGKNVGLLLVQEGYATVIRHRKDDTDRSPIYDELLAAQDTAKEEKKGMWTGKAPKIRQYADASESVQKARIQLSTLQRQRKVPGVIDFCKSGSRFTILIPREGVKMTMVLAGVRAPRAGRSPQEKGEPFGNEALDLANKRCNQRDCEVDIHDIDKMGGFIGDLYVNRESFAKVLVEEGLASVHAYSAEKSGNATELLAAQQRAKEGRKGMWHEWDPSQDEEVEETAPAETTPESDATLEKKPVDYRDIVITNIDENGRLKIQEIGKGTALLETMMNEFKKFHLDSKNNVAVKDAPKAGDYVAARFSADNQWYRARIRSNDRAAKMAEVVYIDYGNVEKQPWSKLRPLDQPQFSPQKLRGQAIDASLSFVQLPGPPEYLKDAISFIYECAGGGERPLVGSFDYQDSKENLSYITIFDPKASSSGPNIQESINREVILGGYGMVPLKLKPWERSKVFEDTLKSLKSAQDQAKQDHAGMWEYGDITED